MELLLWVAIVIFVLVVTLVLIKRNGLGPGISEDEYDSNAETNALEKRYQAEQQDGPRTG